MQAPTADVQPHTWGAAPELYGPRHDFRESLLMAQLRSRLAAGHVLNAGAGAGSFTLRLLDAGYQVTSIDASEAFVAHLTRQLIDRGEKDARVEIGDLHSLRFADDEFDGVVAGEVLEHLADDRAAAAELVRVLRPGGVVAVSVPANPWRYDWSDRWAGHERRYSADGLRRLLEGAGLTAVEVTPYGFPFTGLYHRQVYRRLLRRRLQGDDAQLTAPAGAQRLLSPLVRAMLQLDVLFLGRFPGYFGLLATAAKP